MKNNLYKGRSDNFMGNTRISTQYINGNKVKQLLSEKSIKQISLANQLHYSKQSFNRILQNNRILNFKGLDQIAQKLDVDPLYLTDEIDIPLPYPTPTYLDQTQLHTIRNVKNININININNYLNEIVNRAIEECPKNKKIDEYIKEHIKYIK